MKKAILIFLSFIFLLTTIIIGSKSIRDELYWHLLTTNAIQSFKSYVNKFPEGKYISQAKYGIDSLQWIQAYDENTALSYQRYIDAQPSGNFIDEANLNKSLALKNDYPYITAKELGTLQAYENFIKQFPGHIREAEVKSILNDMEGRDIIDLIDEKKVEPDAFGSGKIDGVQIKLRSLVDYDVRVEIPVGTFFVCNGRAQNMVSTAPKIIDLKGYDEVTVSVYAACANLFRAIPKDEDKFSIRRSSKQRQLQKLITVLNMNSVNSNVKQAAVWIVTDDATYSSLGRLVLGIEGANYVSDGGLRLINMNETVEAMKICVNAGIDIKSKAIWKDHEKIYLRLKPDNALREWLETQNPALVQRENKLKNQIEAKLLSLEKKFVETLRAKPLNILLSLSHEAKSPYTDKVISYLQGLGNVVNLGRDRFYQGVRVTVTFRDGLKNEAMALSKVMELFFNNVEIKKIKGLGDLKTDLYVFVSMNF